MAASYPDSVKSFTAINDGDVVADEMWEEAYEELVAIEQALLATGLAHPLVPDATANARTLGSTSKYWGQAYVKGLTLGASAELTIASGVVTASPGVCKLDTESDAASDDLDTITAGTGVAENSILILRAENVSRIVTLKDGSGNLLLNGDFALSATDRQIALLYDGTNWCELARTAFTVPANVTVLDRDVTVNDVNTSSSETTVYSFSVPGGTLGSTKQLRLTLFADYLNNSGGGSDLTVRVKLGATTIFTGTHTMGASANRGAQSLAVLLSAANATNAQRAVAHWHSSEGAENNAAGALTQNSSTNREYRGVRNSISEDSTGALTLSVTVQHSVSDVAVSFRCHIAVLEGLD